MLVAQPREGRPSCSTATDAWLDKNLKREQKSQVGYDNGVYRTHLKSGDGVASVASVAHLGASGLARVAVIHDMREKGLDGLTRTNRRKCSNK